LLSLPCKVNADEVARLVNFRSCLVSIRRSQGAYILLTQRTDENGVCEHEQRGVRESSHKRDGLRPATYFASLNSRIRSVYGPAPSCWNDVATIP
jgi:hypothetical protein